MAGPHENLEHAEHAQHAAHEGGRDNKKIALIISVLALFLAFSETFGKSAQTAALNSQIEASNLWNFFQAKNIRRTDDDRGDRDGQDRSRCGARRDQRKAALAKQIDEWAKTAARYQSEPEAGGGKGEGTRELSKPRAWRWRRIAISTSTSTTISNSLPPRSRSASCCASAAVITGIVALAYGAVGVGLLGVVLTGTGLFMPELLHDILHWFEALFAGGGGTDGTTPPAARRRGGGGARDGGRSGSGGRASSASASGVPRA